MALHCSLAEQWRPGEEEEEEEEEEREGEEGDCQQTVAPPFGGLHFTHASLQTTPLGSAHVQET